MANNRRHNTDEERLEASDTDSEAEFSGNGEEHQEERSEHRQDDRLNLRRSPSPPPQIIAFVGHQVIRNMIHFHVQYDHGYDDAWIKERNLKDHELPLVNAYLLNLPAYNSPLITVTSVKKCPVTGRKLYQVKYRRLNENQGVHKWIENLDPRIIKAFKKRLLKLFPDKNRRQMYAELGMEHEIEINQLIDHLVDRDGCVWFKVEWKAHERIEDWSEIPGEIREDLVEEDEKPLVWEYMDSVPFHRNPYFKKITGVQVRGGVTHYEVHMKTIGSSRINVHWMPEGNLDPNAVNAFKEERGRNSNDDDPPAKDRRQESPGPGPSHRQ